MRITALVAALLFVGVAGLFGSDSDSQLKPGSPAPEFTLPSQDGSNLSLKDFRGKWVVLYFYPRDMTSGCTIEARNFQKDQPEFQKKNAVVLGVSVDSVDSHKTFCAKVTRKMSLDTLLDLFEDFGQALSLDRQIPS